LDQPFELEVDASGFALGAVLTQRGTDKKKHPIAYFSTTLSEAERNYDIYDLELLAIVKALRHWRQFLAGSPTKSRYTPTTPICNTGDNHTRLADEWHEKY
jgi:hypothetical protein